MYRNEDGGEEREGRRWKLCRNDRCTIVAKCIDMGLALEGTIRTGLRQIVLPPGVRQIVLPLVR